MLAYLRVSLPTSTLFCVQPARVPLKLLVGTLCASYAHLNFAVCVLYYLTLCHTYRTFCYVLSQLPCSEILFTHRFAALLRFRLTATDLHCAFVDADLYSPFDRRPLLPFAYLIAAPSPFPPFVYCTTYTSPSYHLSSATFILLLTIAVKH